MPDSPPEQNDGKSLSEEDLRALARRHAMILRKFRVLRERELARREQQALAYSFAQQIAMSSPKGQAVQPTRARIESSRQISNEPETRSSETEKTEHEVVAAGTTEPSVLPPSEVEHFPVLKKAPSTTIRFLKKMGAGSLAFSLIFHASLIFFALSWVISIYVAPPETPPTFFATGSGGGQGGDRPTSTDALKQRRAANLGAKMVQHKIISNANNSQLVLPKMPTVEFPSPLATEFASAGAVRNLGSGILSSGSGGGIGGGVGLGFGSGIGNARNFISRFQTKQNILGTDVIASRLAVYMDASPSMTEVLPLVRKEILKKFPTADVYEFFGCGITSIPEAKRSKADEKTWARKKEQLLKLYDREKKSSSVQRILKSTLRKNLKKVADDPMGWQKNLSSYGKTLIDMWSGDDYYFRMDLGGWLNMVLTEGGYDAIIVFADFQDYSDGSLMGEDSVLERWVGLARDNQQRFYFFTTESVPQKIFLTLTDYTGGEAAQPKEVAKNSEQAKAAARILRKMKKQKENGGAPTTLVSTKEPTVAEDFSEDESVTADDEDFDDEELGWGENTEPVNEGEEEIHETEIDEDDSEIEIDLGLENDAEKPEEIDEVRSKENQTKTSTGTTSFGKRQKG